jgi:hypothetical protein
MGHIVAVRHFTDGQIHVWPTRFGQIPKRAWRWVTSDFDNGPGPRFGTGNWSSFANGHTAGARLFERRPVCHYAARLAQPRTNGLWPVVEKWVMTRFEMGTECFPECVGPPARPCPPARSRMGRTHLKNIHGARFSAARG